MTMHRPVSPSRHPLQEALHAQCRRFLADQALQHTFFSPIREEGHRLFAQQSLPTRKHEAYRYTPVLEEVAPLFHEAPRLAKPSMPLPPVPSILASLDAYLLTVVHGSLCPSETDLSSLPFQASSLVEGYARHPDLFRDHFQRQADASLDPWVALNTTLFGEGCFVYVPPHTQLSKPILLHHHCHTLTPATCYPRTLVVLGAQSQATVVEVFTTPPLSAPVFVDSVTEVVLASDGHLTYYPLHVDHSPSHHLRYTYVAQAARSTCDQYFAAAPLNAPLVRDEMTLRLRGPAARATLQGIYRSHANTHLALHTAVHHDSPDTTTTQHYRGMGEGTSTTLFDGAIHIPSQSQRVMATQHHQGWLLSDQAVIYARPQLAIEADDVQCTHGTTTVHFDPLTLAYIQGRGLSQDQAQQMLQQAFLAQALQTIPHEPLRQVVQEALYHPVFNP